MAHYCSDCSKLNLKEEKYPGCYECKKKKKDKEKNPYVWACNDACDKFDFDNSRNSAKKPRRSIFITWLITSVPDDLM